jgi:hypothetical protein
MPFADEPLTLDQTLAGRKLSRNSGLIVLNIILSIVQLSSYATGYDGSMMSESPSPRKKSVKATG